MNISKLKNSRFLTKEDCDPPIVVTMKDVHQDNVAPSDAVAEFRYVLAFEEDDIKPMVLNPTNGELIAKHVGSQEMDDWPGKKVVLYHDDTVMFAGKCVGGIRARKYEDNEDTIPW